MHEPTRPNQHPTFASPGRRVLHDLIALAGWILFVWWWWIVFQRVSRDEIFFTIMFVTVSLVVIVGVTALWAWHNKEIFNRRGPRRQAREVTPDFSHDAVGRPLAFYGPEGSPRTARVVHVRITEDGKRYEPAEGLMPAAEAAAQPAVPSGAEPS